MRTIISSVLALVLLLAVISFGYTPTAKISMEPTTITPCQVTQVVFTEPAVVTAETPVQINFPTMKIVGKLPAKTTTVAVDNY
jgi:hypothetical protein